MELNPNMPVEVTTPTPAPVPDAPAPVTAEDFKNLKELAEVQAAQLAELRATIEAAAAPDPPKPLSPEEDPENKMFASPKELREEMKRTAAEITRAQIESIEEERRKLSAAEKSRRDEMDKEFDMMIDDAQAQGLIRPITDQNSTDDVGKKDRRELFGLAAKLRTSDLIAVAEELKSRHDDGYEFDVDAKKFVKIGGGNSPRPVAPVGSSSSRTASPTSGRPSYKDIHTKSLDRLLADYK